MRINLLLSILFCSFLKAMHEKSVAIPVHIQQEVEKIADKMGFKKLSNDNHLFGHWSGIEITIVPKIKSKYKSIGYKYKNYSQGCFIKDKEYSVQRYAVIQIPMREVGRKAEWRQSIIGHEFGHLQQNFEDSEMTTKIQNGKIVAWKYELLNKHYIAAVYGSLLMICYSAGNKDFFIPSICALCSIIAMPVLRIFRANRHNRSIEYEADKRAVVKLKNYDDFIEERKNSYIKWGFLSRFCWFLETHPTDNQRIAQIERLKSQDPEYLKRG